MAQFPGMFEEEEDELAPVNSIAGPQTPRDKVMERIAQVRGGTGEDEQGSDPDMEFAKQSAMSASMGRGLNALAAGTGFRADNSGYDAMEKRGSDALSRGAAVRKSIADRQSKDKAFSLREQQMAETGRHNRAMEAGMGMRLAKNRDIDALPAEDAEVVKDLAKKNASKIAISNQIDAVMGGWDDLSDDQKLMAGRQLIKVLNSTEGADAVGVEEANRLGGKLEFAMGNLTNSNPIQFGRDLPGFKEQASGTSAAIKEAIRANQMHQNKLYRNHGVARTDPAAPERVAKAPKASGGGLVPEAHAAGSGRVTVTNGKERLSIELKDLPDAMADGFQVMK